MSCSNMRLPEDYGRCREVNIERLYQLHKRAIMIKSIQSFIEVTTEYIKNLLPRT